MRRGPKWSTTRGAVFAPGADIEALRCPKARLTSVAVNPRRQLLGDPVVLVGREEPSPNLLVGTTASPTRVGLEPSHVAEGAANLVRGDAFFLRDAAELGGVRELGHAGATVDGDAATEDPLLALVLLGAEVLVDQQPLADRHS
jgi:hypothetical protein